MKDVQSVNLDILKDVHSFCVNNDIRYSLCGGSLIGAIRHNGFIPWDDDVDVVMPRPDYDKFIKSYHSENGYKLFSREKDGCKDVRIRIAKVCDMDRTIMVKGFYGWTDSETGIGIDIIPAEGAPDNMEEARYQIETLKKRNRVMKILRLKNVSLSEIKKIHRFRGKIRFLIDKTRSVFLNDDYTMDYINFQKRYDYNSSRYFIAGFKYNIGEWQPKEILDEYELHKFEDAEFFITKRYDQYLRSLVGDYMQLPPGEQRVDHGLYEYYWKS